MNFATHVLGFRLKGKGKHAKLLHELAREVNFVWNYCNELSQQVWQQEQRFLSGYESTRSLGARPKPGYICTPRPSRRLATNTRRKQAGKTRLCWNVTSGPRRSLGWTPFKANAIRYRNGQVFFSGTELSL